MPKNRCKSGEEWLRGRVRELEKQNRQLQKRVRQLEKTEHMFEEALINEEPLDRKSTRLNSSHLKLSRMPSSA